jgi:hypothetical protein
MSFRESKLFYHLLEIHAVAQGVEHPFHMRNASVTNPDKVKLLHGPSRAPSLRVGDRATSLYRDCDVVVTSWTDAPISWPRCRRTEGKGHPPCSWMTSWRGRSVPSRPRRSSITGALANNSSGSDARRSASAGKGPRETLDCIGSPERSAQKACRPRNGQRKNDN